MADFLDIDPRDCPHCGTRMKCNGTTVKDGLVIHRRKCLACGWKKTTYEGEKLRLSNTGATQTVAA